MSKGAEHSGLTDAVAALRHAPGERGAHGRSIFPAGTADPFHAVVKELHETILTRVLTFVRQDGTELAVLASDRRLCRALPSGGLGASALSGQNLTENEAEDLRTAMIRFCNTAETIDVVTQFPEPDIGEIASGIPAIDLLGAGKTGPDDSEALLAIVLEASGATLELEDGETKTKKGDASVLSELLAFRDWFYALQETDEETETILWTGVFKDDTSVVLHRRGTSELWALAHMDTKETVFRLIAAAA
ncbi:hypothetical protein [uncultured Roseobacter sp.]|uniref:hypothetical protein n=1 Tax=uncultured Roseobacter sp. TaxID=114847 RepID=UPI00262FD23C|nr:hypothetical protein [uncultured Roseobacter sp.]